ncbi:MAG TPA: GNAT family N-acetyltransferase [Clostridiales bacterium]|nr:GNAT family N-acetyltransferase [Clostridiales bacterium]
MFPTIDTSTVTLEIERLILRCWREDDLADFNAYASVEGVGEAAGWPHHRSIEDSKRVLERFLAEKNDFAIVERATGRVIGSFGFHKSWADDNEAYKNKCIVEIGYVLARDKWGQGLMPEAVRRVLEYLFLTLGADIVTVGHFADNHRSRRVIEKTGFKRVGEKSVYYKLLGINRTVVRYILTKEEYLCQNT